MERAVCVHQRLLGRSKHGEDTAEGHPKSEEGNEQGETEEESGDLEEERKGGKDKEDTEGKVK